MNATRRKALEALKGRIESAVAELHEVKEEIATLRDEEQEFYDNMPEGLQNGEKGEKATASIDALQEAYDALDALNSDDILGYIDTAVE